MKIWTLVPVILAGFIVWAQEACCPSIEGLGGVGLAFYPPGAFLLSGRFWLTTRSAAEVGIAIQYFNWFYAHAIQVFQSTCAIRLYIIAGIDLPLTNFNWQTGKVGLGMEWCPPRLQNLSISFAGGLELSRWKYYGSWVVGISSWFLFSVYYYF